MVFISEKEMPGIAPLFAGVKESMVWSCLQGEMGRAWADNAQNPGCARIITGDFCFFAGNSEAAGAEELIRQFPEGNPSSFCLLIPPDEGWSGKIAQIYGDRAEKTERYALKKEKNVFDHDRLSFYVRQLPNGYECKPITSALYKTVLREAWSADLCSQFTDEADYEKRGLGFALLHQGRVVCGASSYTVFRGGIEIEIDTHPDFRRKGLAKACSARLILECLDRGLYPSWDAANRASLSLAEALGYHFDKAYVAYVVPREMWQVAAGGTGEEKKKNGQQRR